MDGYDQLWSLVEADEADAVPGLVHTLIHATGGGDLLSAEVQVDLSALESFPEAAPYAADFLTGSAAGDDFFPLHAFTAAPSTGDSLPGIDASAGEPLVLPTAANDVFDVVEPLVLPGVMDDGFVMGGYGDGRQVLPGVADDFLMDDLGADRFAGHHLAGGGFEMPVDHTLVVDDHGLIGAHGTDDWLF